MYKAIALAAVAALLTGCTSAGRITKDVAPAKSESIFVIGLEPRTTVFRYSLEGSVTAGSG